MDGQRTVIYLGLNKLDYLTFFVFQEVMINVGDVGKDYEHGVQLLKKLGEFRGSTDGVRKSQN